MARVLLLDDHPDWRNRLSAVLRRAGHSVVAVGSRDEAIQRLAAAPSIDVAVVDMFIGVGLAASDEICREARELSIPVIAISGPASRTQVAEFFTRHKVVTFLEKVPFDEALFLHQVNRAVRGQVEKLKQSESPQENATSRPSACASATITLIDSKLAAAGESAYDRPSLGAIDEQMFQVIDQTVAQLVEIVRRSAEVNQNIQRDYASKADALRGEVKKSRVNLARIRDILAFLGDIDGTLGLAEKFGPYLAILAPLSGRLVRSLT